MHDKKQLEELLAFVRTQRGKEGNFESIYNKLVEECKATSDEGYRNQLGEIKEKQAATYRQAKEAGAVAWPEFENFVSEFEKTITSMLKEK